MTTLTHYELVNLDEEREHEHEAAPCPFCGSPRVEFVTTNQTSHTSHYAVACVTCDARGPAKREYAQAVEAWNAADRCLR